MPRVPMRYKRLYPRDMQSPVVQKNYSQFIRLGQIISVNSTEGVCTIRWLDRPGFRYDVILSQGAPKEWQIPEEGSMVLVGFDSAEQARILRYINLGQGQRIQRTKTLPKLKPGDKLWEAGGTYIYLDRKGNYRVETATQGSFSLDAASGTFASETVDWRVQTEAGTKFFGIVQRATLNSDGSKSVELIEGNTDEYLTEYKMKLVETADGGLGVTTTDPLVDITMGTVVDDDGLVYDKNGIPTTWNSNSALCLKMVVKKNGTELLHISLTKGGELDVTVDGNVNLTSNADVNVEGQNVVLNNGEKGVAREDDEVSVPITATDIASLNLQVVGFGPVTVTGPTSVTVTGTISTASETVKAGD